MEFKQIPGFSSYRISQSGEIINKSGRKLADYEASNYRAIKLTDDTGVKRTLLVHRLVASTWIGPIPKGCWVNHEDGNKVNNSLSNLTIGTPSENHLHAWRTLGRESGRAKPAQLEAMRTLRSLGWSQHKIAKAFSCSQANVSSLLSAKD